MTESTAKTPARKRPSRAKAKPAPEAAVEPAVEAPADAAPGTLTADLSLELTATLPNGVIVPCTVSLVYPLGMGMHAVQALEKLMASSTAQIYQELLNRKDASLIQALLDNSPEPVDE